MQRNHTEASFFKLDRLGVVFVVTENDVLSRLEVAIEEDLGGTRHEFGDSSAHLRDAVANFGQLLVEVGAKFFRHQPNRPVT